MSGFFLLRDREKLDPGAQRACIASGHCFDTIYVFDAAGRRCDDGNASGYGQDQPSRAVLEQDGQNDQIGGDKQVVTTARNHKTHPKSNSTQTPHHS